MLILVAAWAGTGVGLGAGVNVARAERPDPRLRPEAFWQARPQNDPITAALYQFDDSADAAVAIDDLEEAIGGKKKGPGGKAAPAPSGGDGLGVMSVGGGNYGTPKFALRGDAKNVPDGRWGGGVKLAGAGCVEVTGLDTAKMWEGEGAVTVDVWVKSDVATKKMPWGDAEPTSADNLAALLTLSGISTPDALHVERADDGKVTLWARDKILLTHPRPVPTNVWTHVCLSVGVERAMTATLFIDGQPAIVGPDVLGPHAPGPIALLGGPIRVGGVQNDAKAVARGLRG
ncbi:MAG: hypothetical protein NTW19_14690 [Planctomycetota bacterium]|nr:hypothetical protein [Planctomycetota bacterium]